MNLVKHGRVSRGIIKRCPRGASLRDFVSGRTRLFITTNLHNPSCGQYSEEELREFAEIARGGGMRVLIDEVYLECLYEHGATSFHLGPEFVTTSSLTKLTVSAAFVAAGSSLNRISRSVCGASMI
jgi:bifunctional pyridoxal-dependent enzyme with beta-cystathionase and maltose regulon repressor activities